jgi:O-antigen ligase
MSASLDSMKGLVGLLLAVSLSLLLGVAIVDAPALGPPLILLVSVSIWVAVRGQLVWWDMLVFVVAGLYVLDHGFSNVGVQVPLVDLLAALLVLRIATQPGFRWPGSPPFVLGLAFLSLTVLRLLADYPTHGALAMRDATLGFEVTFLLIGYWAIHEFGLPRIVRMLTAVFLVGLGYTALYPFRDTLRAISPMVGLQEPVPLLGSYVGGPGAIIAAVFFFPIVRPFRHSYLVAAAALPIVALLQSRGLYVGIPATIILIAVLARARMGVQIRRRLAAMLAVGVLAALAFFPFAPEGRLGEKAGVSFVAAQLASLVGGDEVGTPVETRTAWFDKVTSAVGEKAQTQLVGLGLGPDLGFGFEDEQGRLVRKPHNDYLEVYGRFGILGFAIFVGMLGSAFVRIVRAARASTGLAGRFLWFAVAQTFMFMLIAAAQPLLAFPYGTVPLFFILGAALAVSERPRSE